MTFKQYSNSYNFIKKINADFANKEQFFKYRKAYERYGKKYSVEKLVKLHDEGWHKFWDKEKEQKQTKDKAEHLKLENQMKRIEHNIDLYYNALIAITEYKFPKIEKYINEKTA